MIDAQKLYSNVSSYDESVNKKQLDYAFQFAKNNHKGQFRESGEDYITHPIAVAEILIK